MMVVVLCSSRVRGSWRQSTSLLLHPFFQDNQGKPAPERYRTVLDFNEARDDRVAVALAGPYANHLHLSPGR